MFLDIAIGIFLSIGASWFFKIELTTFLVMASIFFVILPDVDFLWVWFRRGKAALRHSHREIFHHPLVLIPIGFLILLIFNKIYAFLFLIATLWHFLVGDTVFLGFGVHWLWPFSDKYFSLFGMCGYQTPGKPKLPFKFLYVWTPEEIEELEEKYGDPDWIKNIYLKPHPLAIVEYVFFILSIILLVFYSK